MSLDTIINDAVYDTMVADDATYIDASGEEIAVRVVPEYIEDEYGDGSHGVRGGAMAFRMLRSAIGTEPRKGEHIEHEGTRYCVDGAPSAIDSSPLEWRVYVVD